MRCGRFRYLFAFPIFVIGSGSLYAAATAPVRRALLVGINQYAMSIKGPVLDNTVSAAGRVLPMGKSPRRHWQDLDGAVNDAIEMKSVLKGRFGFQEADIVLLVDEQATANAILSSLQRHLIDSAKPGDISLFFYAGHGSRIRNIATTELSGYDQTLVPADAPSGVPDIRDKVLARVFNRAVQKGVTLSVIVDSCHSGSIARGVWNRSGKTRELEPDGRYVSDPPDRTASGELVPTPEQQGVLVLSASQDFQAAAEIETENGAHGLFTWALLRVLRTFPPSERMDRVFRRVRALMQSEGILQEPVLAGKTRSGKSLLGREADSSNEVTAPVSSVSNDAVWLQAGAGVGLYEGCELKKKDSPLVRIRVTKITGLSSAEAVVQEGNLASVHEGDLFELDRWLVPETAMLRVYFPSSTLPIRKLLRVAERMRAASVRAGIEWVDDPTERPPTRVMSWSGSSWILERNPAQGPPIDLGINPGAERVVQFLRDAGQAKFFLLLPPPAELLRNIQLGPGKPNSSISLEGSPGRAHYVLYGAYAAGSLRYAWVLPDIVTAQASGRKDQMLSVMTSLPERSDWLSVDDTAMADKLTDQAMQLGKIRAWLNLDAPTDNSRFPYHLALQKRRSGAAVTAGALVEGEKFNLILRVEPESLRQADESGGIAKRYVYVFVIDHYGRQQLLYPPAEIGNVENRFPILNPDTLKIAASFELRGGLQVGEPLGLDTFFLLVSEEPLPMPEVLDSNGVRTRGTVSPLARLLANWGRNRRGGSQSPPAVRLNWSLERLTFRSVPKSMPEKPSEGTSDR